MCFPLACCVWMLLSFNFAFGDEMYTAVNALTTLYYHQEDSANISCSSLPSNELDIFTVKLEKNNKPLCSFIRITMELWKYQSCDYHIRFILIPETNEIFFGLSNLQITDSGTYSCTVRRLTPPPETILWEEITKVNVIVPPVLSCVKRPNRSPTIICSAEGFYPAALEQQWMRDGEIINSSYSHKDENYSTNPSGSLTQMFYQELPSQMFETIFSCWVNHSSLNEPLSANLSSSVCYDQRGRAQPQSSVEVSVTPETVFQSVLQSDVVYSSLGDHHPVPCSRSPSVNWSPLNTD
ncbi:uncharacterized protein LOC130411437 [Triplophysa dalaica]|uniref:uncharacterized protein LOC130411437 n=1 Tax=Triplophysa dalaica TaxID=1582913 RepID=UPI0024E01395|nr:uncharacterized protein LOC130411437 [Triplophysa dalaica]